MAFLFTLPLWVLGITIIMIKTFLFLSETIYPFIGRTSFVIWWACWQSTSNTSNTISVKILPFFTMFEKFGIEEAPQKRAFLF